MGLCFLRSLHASEEPGVARANRSMRYRPDIDGLRAVAVVAVMLYHTDARWLPGGFVGVDVFFVISGFVVSASLAASAQRRFGDFLAEFYARRLARIVPALVVMLAIASIAHTLFIPRAWLSRFSEQTALSAFVGLGNWVMQRNADAYFAPLAAFNPYAHTWSLGVEEQFYVVCPMLLFLWVRARLRETPRAQMLAQLLLGAVGIASLAGCAWATRAQPTPAFYSVLFRFWELAAGVLLYELSASRPSTTRRLSISKSAAGWVGLLIVCATMIFATEHDFPFPWAVAVVMGTTLILGDAHDAAGDPLRRLLAHPALVWIGRRSYSLYLPFAAKGMNILFAAPTPLFRHSPFRCSDRFNRANPACRGGLSEQRAYLELLRAPIVAAMHTIANELPAVHLWDPFTVLCPASVCTVTRDGRPIFFDGNHLSAYGDAVVYPSFAESVAALAAPRLH